MNQRQSEKTKQLNTQVTANPFHLESDLSLSLCGTAMDDDDEKFLIDLKWVDMPSSNRL